MDKQGIQFSFGWIFAIIIGAVIIFLAIFATTNLIRTDRTQIEAEVGEQLGILLNPVETNLESGKYFKITFPQEARVFNKCRDIGNFGQQRLSVSLKSSIGEPWQAPETENVFLNKYLFSEKVEQGKSLHLFVKPFEFPYKVADLIFASAEDYCFVNPPTDIEDDILGLNPENINISTSISSCPRKSKVVCFGSAGCDVNVNFQTKSVEKNGISVNYEGNLIYGAIFADADVYECQVQRLMKRTGELAQLYATKTEILSNKGCSSNLETDLRAYSQGSQIESSSEIGDVALLAESLERRNDALSCKLF